MTPSDRWRDRLIETLLREELGGDAPPDVSARVAAAGSPRPALRPTRRRTAWAAAGLAAAAAVLAVATFWTRDASPFAGPGVQVEGGRLLRGATVRTGGRPGELRLGGYCRLDMRPNTVLELGGEPGNERVELTAGQVVCEVTPGRGGFGVRTPHARVDALGTTFSVWVQTGRAGPAGRVTDWTVVGVKDGRVSVGGDWGSADLGPGDLRRFPPPIEPFAARVAALPLAARGAAVAARLRELNPGFDGRHTAVVLEGEVREFTVRTDAITDLEPLRALPYLWTVNLTPTPGSRGQVTSLAPLSEHWELITLIAPDQPIEDLSPLVGKPLTVAMLSNTAVRDLSPLRGSPVKVLHVNNAPIGDLVPLQGLPLTELACVFDAAPERDLSPVEGCPLNRLWCSLPGERNREVLRRMPTLRTVNDRPRAEAVGP
ncbi:FecR domain-containing protein [Gemmata sp.]|uniref:FecR domain-containing protein n=1 Tax=Gemmata sp. TaxID=1914242 RepID=UPI003F72DFF6